MGASKTPVGIIDYGMGNLLSVQNALKKLKVDSFLCEQAGDLEKVERIIFPGVGAFRDCMANLKQRGFIDGLNDHVIKRKKPILGICLGMQAMARKSFEGGEYQGLGWFDADIVKLKPKAEFKVPHMGWNDISWRMANPLSEKLPAKVDVYFVHSYHMKCDDDGDVVATCDYDGVVTAAVRKNHIFATQFHPEKSQEHGLKILENFMKWKG